MPAIGRTETSDCSNHVLDLYTRLGGVLVDVFSVEFQVFDKTGVSPVQVFPASVGAKEPVAVGVTCPLAGAGRIGVGHYVATWTVPALENVGTHEVRWFFKLTSSSPEATFSEEFEVLAVVGGSSDDTYASVQDLRDEGVTVAQASDAQVLAALVRASRFIEQATRRYFNARSHTFTLDGLGTSCLFIDEPIIALSTITIDGFALDVAEDVKIYNRHLAQRLTRPDDRNNPKVEFSSGWWGWPGGGSRTPTSRVWSRGVQNVEVSGVFGYTDPDGSATGATPELVKRACVMLAARDAFPLASGDRADAAAASRLTEERTRDQSYKLGRGRIDLMGGPGGATPWTDDPEINTILDLYRAPPMVRTTR